MDWVRGGAVRMQGKVTMMMGAEVGDWEDRVPKQEGLQSASVGTLKASLTLCHPALAPAVMLDVAAGHPAHAC